MKGVKETKGSKKKQICSISYLQAGKENIMKTFSQDKSKNIKAECEVTEQELQKVDFKTKFRKRTMEI